MTDTLTTSNSDPGTAVEKIVLDLREHRKALGLSQRAVAQSMGTTQSAVSDIEKMQSVPRVSTLLRYARSVGAEVRLELDLPALPTRAAETEPPDPDVVYEDFAVADLATYLVVRGRQVAWAGVDKQRAHEFAARVGGVVTRLPVFGDYRPAPGAGSPA